jgi:ubiquinone/menaquinone biosynthesis C-methylase UbiE
MPRTGLTEHRVDYDRIAADYDRRYQGRRYEGVEQSLRAWLEGSPARRVLEVGCGTGHWLDALSAPGRHMIGLDRSAGMLARARATAPGAPLVRSVAAPLPFANASLDAVLCMNALHHFPDKPAFVAEAARVLAPGGELRTIGLDPHRGNPRWAVYEYFDGTREADAERYPPSSAIRSWLEACGFAECASRVVEHIQRRQPAERALESPMMGKDGTSQLALLSDEAFERGIERIRREMARARDAGRTLWLESDLELVETSGRIPDW